MSEKVEQRDNPDVWQIDMSALPRFVMTPLPVLYMPSMTTDQDGWGFYSGIWDNKPVAAFSDDVCFCSQCNDPVYGRGLEDLMIAQDEVSR